MSRSDGPPPAQNDGPRAPSVHQGAQAVGHGNIFVPIVGDRNTVVASHHYVQLTRYGWRRSLARSDDLRVLHPYAMATPLVGREPMLGELEAWMDGEQSISVRLLTAAGGVGKTRLALELCERADSRGWDAGFITTEELNRFGASNHLGAWGWQRPTLIVVDYAAAKLASLRVWLKELSTHRGGTKPLRLVLLERHAATDAGWLWELAWRGDATADDIKGMFDPPTPVQLAPLSDVADRRAVFQQAYKAFAGQTAETNGPTTTLDFDRRLTEVSWGGEPLFLLMAAMTAADAGVADALSLSRVDVAFKVADLERVRLRTLAESRHRSPDFTEHLAAYATLCGGIQSANVLPLIEAEQRALSRTNAGDPGDFARVLAEVLPDGTGGVAPVVPDVVGEALILRCLGEGHSGSAQATGALERAVNEAWARVVPILIRLAQDFGDAEPYDERALGWLTHSGHRVAEDLNRLIDFVGQIPERTLVLGPLALELTQRIVDLLRYRDEPSATESDRRLLALALQRLATRLGSLGHRDKALEVSRDSADRWRALAEQRPNAFRQAYANALNNLAVRLSDVGQWHEALGFSQQSVELHRILAPTVDRAALSPDLAAALITLTNLLSNLGLDDDALAAAAEVVASYRALDSARPGLFRSELAGALLTYGDQLCHLGRPQEAIKITEDGIAVLRELAIARPDAFRSERAGALINLASQLGAVGRHTDAATVGAESVDQLRALVGANPAKFRPHLAGALNNLGNQHARLGQHREALVAAEEAVHIQRELVATHPERFTRDLVQALVNLVDRLTDLGRGTETFVLAREAAELCVVSGGVQSLANAPNLAAAVSRLATTAVGAAQIAEALDLTIEALRGLQMYLFTWPRRCVRDMRVLVESYFRLAANPGQRQEPVLIARIMGVLYSIGVDGDSDGTSPAGTVT